MIVPGKRTTKVEVQRNAGGEVHTVADVVAAEEPLEIRIEVPGSRSRDHRVSVTMRTPGHDFELAAGFLYSEGLVRERRALVDLRYCADVEPQEYNVVTARLRSSDDFDPDLLNRNFYVTSSCGVCGKASLEAVEVQGCAPLPVGTLKVSDQVVMEAPSELRRQQEVFGRTGGIHAAGLFSAEGTAAVVREDVGRHNAVDKVIGHALLAGRLPLAESFLTVSGRTSFEIVQKALMAGIPMVVAVGAPSSLAVDLAVRFNMTLIGFARDNGFNVYHGAERVEHRLVGNP